MLLDCDIMSVNPITRQLSERDIFSKGRESIEGGKIIQQPRNRPNQRQSRPRLITRYLRSPLEITVESNGRFRESRDGAANGPQWGKTVAKRHTNLPDIAYNYHGSGIPEDPAFYGDYRRKRLPFAFQFMSLRVSRENLDFAPLNLRFHSDSGMMQNSGQSRKYVCVCVCVCVGERCCLFYRFLDIEKDPYIIYTIFNIQFLIFHLCSTSNILDRAGQSKRENFLPPLFKIYLERNYKGQN